MGWAAAMDCQSAPILQVEQSNAVAINLYGNLGFRELYQLQGTRISRLRLQRVSSAVP